MGRFGPYSPSNGESLKAEILKMIVKIFVIIGVVIAASAVNQGDDKILLKERKELSEERKEITELFRHKTKKLRQEDGQLRAKLEKQQDQNQKLQKQIAKLEKENQKLRRADSKINKKIRLRWKGKPTILFANMTSLCRRRSSSNRLSAAYQKREAPSPR